MIVLFSNKQRSTDTWYHTNHFTLRWSCWKLSPCLFECYSSFNKNSWLFRQNWFQATWKDGSLPRRLRLRKAASDSNSGLSLCCYDPSNLTCILANDGFFWKERKIRSALGRETLLISWSWFHCFSLNICVSFWEGRVQFCCLFFGQANHHTWAD